MIFRMTPSVNVEQLELSSPVLALRKVGASSHIPFAGAYYSVPHILFGNTVIVRATGSFVDILDCNGACVASHRRSFINRKYITDPAHLPDFNYSLLWNDRYDAAKLRSWARKIGDNTFRLIDAMLERKPFEEHAYRSCLAILVIAKKYGSFILDKACEQALSADTLNFKAVQNLASVEFNKHFNIS